ncbi:MAG: hypothetical protein ACREL9_14380 [Gemmatimonadales bacterium]
MTLRAIALNLFAASLLATPRALSAQDPCEQINPPPPPSCWSVSVTPDGQGTPTRPANTGGYSATFTVENFGLGDTYDITCSGAGNVTCTGTSVPSVIFTGYGSTTVTAFYSVGAPGTATLTLSAWGSNAGDDGSYSVTAIAGALPIVDLTPHNYDAQNMARCAASCFAATYAQSTVPYFSLGVPRSVTLAYHGDRVDPKPFVRLNARHGGDASNLPTAFRLQVKKADGSLITFLNGETTLRFTASLEQRRLGGQFDAAANAMGTTGAYAVTVVVGAEYARGVLETALATKVTIVNETGAPVARGWTLGGIQRLYVQGDGSALITEGDGSAVYFLKSGANFVAPAGEFSQLVTGTPSGGSGWTRRWPDSTKVVFNAAGLMIELRDRWNNMGTILYDASNRVYQITDPLNLAIILNYGSNGLSSTIDPQNRTTSVTVDASRRLTAITDPDNASTAFGYEANLRLSTITDRRGFTTTLYYHDVPAKLDSVRTPSITLFDGTSPQLTTALKSWQRVGVPYGSTATPVAAPLADTVCARVTDPGGHVTRFTVNRWGAPGRTTDALGGVTTVTYDAGGLPIRIVDPSGGVDTVAYGASGLPTYLKAAGTSAAQLRYAGWAQVDSSWGDGRPGVRHFIGANSRFDSTRTGGGTPDAAVARYTYEVRGRVERVTDPQGHLTGRFWYAGANGN